MTEFKSCPFCGSTNIGVKDNIINVMMGADCPSTAIRKIWAYCRYCEAEGPKRTAEVISDDEVIAVALESWNMR